MTKNRIPSLGAAALALAGGCGDSGSPLDNLQDALSEFCMHGATCLPESDDYTDCELADEDFQGVSDACINSYALYYDCLRDVSCEVLVDADADVCVDEGNSIDDNCGEFF